MIRPAGAIQKIGHDLLPISAVCICWISLSGFSAPEYVPEQAREQNPPGHEWQHVTSSSDSKYFINLRTIRISGPFVKAWGLNNSEGNIHGKAYRSSRWMDEYDCAREESRSLTISAHAEQYGGGAIIGTESRPGQWKSIPPGTVGETLWHFFCRIHELSSLGSDQWVKISGDETHAVYAAPSTKKRSGSIVTMVVLNDYADPIMGKNGVTTQSGKGIQEFDCASRLIKSTSQFVNYSEEMGHGTVVLVGSFSPLDDSEWMHVHVKTPGEDIWKYACQPLKK